MGIFSAYTPRHGQPTRKQRDTRYAAQGRKAAAQQSKNGGRGRAV